MLYKKYNTISNVIEDNKRELLLSDVNDSLDSMNPEDAFISLNYAMKTSMDKTPLAQPKKLFANKPVDAFALSSFFEKSKQDLQILYSSISDLENELGSYIEISGVGSNTLDSTMNELLSKLGNLRLYSASKHKGFTPTTFEFKDLKESAQINEDSCNIDTNGSVLTLSWDESPEVFDIAQVSIANGSNGTSGNLVGNMLNNNDISAIFDGDASTGFIYSKTTRDETSLNLILEFKFNELTVMNNVLLKASGTENSYPTIISLSLSSDGEVWNDGLEYFKRKDGLDKAALNLGSNENFIPGVRSIHFRPQPVLIARLHLRKYSFVKVGDRNSFEIGLKECLFRAIKYKETSEFVSREVNDLSEFVKIGVISDEEYGSFNSTVDHYISSDENSWQKIDPLYIDSSDAPSLLTFNLHTEDSLSTEAPLVNIQYKIQLTKGNSPTIVPNVSQKTLENFEVFSLSPTVNKLNLLQQPIVNSLSVLSSLPFTIGQTGYSIRELNGEENDFIVIQLPFKLQPDQEVIFANGRRWLRVNSIEEKVTQNNGLVYILDYDSSTLVFSKRVDENGDLLAQFPKGNIEIRVKPEISKILENGTLELSNYSNGDKASTRIFKIGKTPLQAIELLPIDQRIIDLQYDRILKRDDLDLLNIDLIGPQILVNNAIWSSLEVSFLDGVSEFLLDTSATYSIDYDKGILYLKNAFENDGYSIVYPYLPRELVYNWKFETNLNKITVNSSELVLFNKTVRLASVFSATLLPKYLGTIKKSSVRINGFQEISYLNGKREFVQTGLSASDQLVLFSIDYQTNRIFFSSSFTGIIQFAYAGFEVEYTPMTLLSNKDFTLTGKDLQLSTGIVSNLALANQIKSVNSLIQVYYKYVPQEDTSLQNIRAYETPIVFSATLITLNKNQLLGTL